MRGEIIMKKLIAILFSITTLIYPALAVIDAIEAPAGFVEDLFSNSIIVFLPILSLILKAIAFSKNSVFVGVLALLNDLIVMIPVLFAAMMIAALGGIVEQIILITWAILGIVNVFMIIPASRG